MYGFEIHFQLSHKDHWRGIFNQLISQIRRSARDCEEINPFLCCRDLSSLRLRPLLLLLLLLLSFYWITSRALINPLKTRLASFRKAIMRVTARPWKQKEERGGGGRGGGPKRCGGIDGAPFLFVGSEVRTFFNGDFPLPRPSSELRPLLMRKGGTGQEARAHARNHSHSHTHTQVHAR